MFRTSKIITTCLVCFWIATLTQSGDAKSIAQPIAVEPKQVDLVIALDVSGSMSGLIESAKQRLWDIVNELGQAQPQPELRVAIVTYGNPNYGQHTGYVKIDQPFTNDLDAVNETLFSFGTDGGDEYVARAVDTSLKQLDWSNGPNTMGIIFVAGNESATQDPQITIQSVTQAANAKGIVVNTIYCGSEGDDIAQGWAKVANLTQGMYASIDQNAAAVANVSTPMDQELAKLNQELNKTYIAFGKEGKKRKENQHEQDAKTASLSAPAAASRVVTKSSGLYNSSGWDMVDAIKAGKRLEEFETEELPKEMQTMTKDQRSDFVGAQTVKRENLQQEIQDLGEQRRRYIAKNKADSNEQGLDDAIREGLRKVAKDKGLVLKN